MWMMTLRLINWLQAISEAFEDSDTHLVGGKNLPKYESTPPDWLDTFWYREGSLKSVFLSQSYGLWRSTYRN